MDRWCPRCSKIVPPETVHVPGLVAGQVASLICPECFGPTSEVPRTWLTVSGCALLSLLGLGGCVATIMCGGFLSMTGTGVTRPEAPPRIMAPVPSISSTAPASVEKPQAAPSIEDPPAAPVAATPGPELPAAFRMRGDADPAPARPSDATEKEAASKLSLAKNVMNKSETTGRKRLHEIVEKYPGTAAAAEAAKLLAK